MFSFIHILKILYQKSDFIKFFSTGLDSGFKIKEIYLLYQAASFANVPEPLALFLSVPALNNCIAYIIKDAQDIELYQARLFCFNIGVFPVWFWQANFD